MPKRKIILISVILISLISISNVAYSTNVSSKIVIKNKNISLKTYPFNNHDIIIPNDYPTIQQGINNSKPGNSIFVRSGVYKENLIVNIQNLSITGEDNFATVIDGDRASKKHAVDISAENITFKNFTVKNGWNKDETLWDLSGIRINASNTKIIGNIITQNRLGICTMPKTYNHTFKDNVFINDGLMFADYVYNYHMSIYDFIHVMENNTVNGKPLYYFLNANDFTVPYDAGQLILVNCTNVTVKNLDLKDTDFAITLAGCSKCNVSNNTINNTDGELILFLSVNNTIQNNKISNNLHGICLDYESKNNEVCYNDVSENWIGISSITGSKYNRIHSNKVYGNKAGIEITTYYFPMNSHNHEVYNNQIFNNNFGIMITEGSENISAHNNDIHNNIVGINLRKSENNNISRNILSKNIFSALFSGCKKNIWNNNYWNRPRILPKPIFGFKTVGKIPIPWINFDRNPARQPNI